MRHINRFLIPAVLAVALAGCGSQDNPAGPNNPGGTGGGMGPSQYDGIYSVTTSQDVPGDFLIMDIHVSGGEVVYVDTGYRLDLSCSASQGGRRRITPTPPAAITGASFSFSKVGPPVSFIKMRGTFFGNTVAGTLDWRYYEPGAAGCDQRFPNVTFSGTK